MPVLRPASQAGPMLNVVVLGLIPNKSEMEVLFFSVRNKV